MTIAQSVERVKAWMNTHGASVLVDNLANGATVTELDAFEKKVGFSLPHDLRELWAIHAGQHAEQNGFVGVMDLLGPEGAAAEQDGVAMFLESLREDHELFDEAGVTEDEAASDAWLAIACRGYADQLVVCCLTGRVFTCEKDSPPFHRIASSVTEWLEEYATRVEAGSYTVEEGFGDCYLARDDAMF